MSKPKPQRIHLLLIAILSFAFLFRPSEADIGTASKYNPPYSPTACFGGDRSQFPASNLFAAAGEKVWDNGAACGRQYLLKCINSAVAGACVQGQQIQVIVVDRALTSVSKPSRADTNLVLSNTAYAAVANPSASFINIDFIQV
ncbi:OLC1v1030225C1 [Oldenlandia corymbosa var. corymbosa]|uniref:OLC1v1030225C1 n=1 Tax=Oldenlandia corymbosa var. corymbosa TaxID=529605 RepID=A0AAV1CHF7_OLDCO|nr:OLC1v1030225C1 [Oldenlandia corymbosa var. corymbosa]